MVTPPNKEKKMFIVNWTWMASSSDLLNLFSDRSFYLKWNLRLIASNVWMTELEWRLFEFVFLLVFIPLLVLSLFVFFFGNFGLFEKAELFLWTFIPERAESILLQFVFSFYLTCFGSNLTLRERLFFFYCSSTNPDLKKMACFAWASVYLSKDVCLCCYSVQYIRLRVRICC